MLFGNDLPVLQHGSVCLPYRTPWSNSIEIVLVCKVDVRFLKTQSVWEAETYLPDVGAQI